jgi:hypothetical protein
LPSQDERREATVRIGDAEVSRKHFDAAKPGAGSGAFTLPDADLTIDYGKQRPGSQQPMPTERRAQFRERLKRAARSGGNAWRIFVRRSNV